MNIQVSRAHSLTREGKDGYFDTKHLPDTWQNSLQNSTCNCFSRFQQERGGNRIIDSCHLTKATSEAGLVLIKGTLPFNSEPKILSLQRPTFILLQGCDRDLSMSGMIKRKHGNNMSSHKLLQPLPNVQEIPHSTHPYGSAGEHFYQHMAPWKWRFSFEFFITIACFS